MKKLKSLSCVFLKEKCLNLEKYLKCDNLLDFYNLDLFIKLNILKKIIESKNNKLIEFLII